MLNSSPATHLDRQSGSLPILRVNGIGDTQRWAADNRDALRSLVIEQGSVLVRGLGLRDARGGRRGLPAAWHRPAC